MPRKHHKPDGYVSRSVSPAITEKGDRIQLPQGATPEGGSTQRRGLCSTRPITGRLRLQRSRPAPSLPHQAPAERAENTGIPRRRKPEEAPALDPLENSIRRLQPAGMRKERSFAVRREQHKLMQNNIAVVSWFIRHRLTGGTPIPAVRRNGGYAHAYRCQIIFWKRRERAV